MPSLKKNFFYEKILFYMNKKTKKMESTHKANRHLQRAQELLRSQSFGQEHQPQFGGSIFSCKKQDLKITELQSECENNKANITRNDEQIKEIKAEINRLHKELEELKMKNEENERLLDPGYMMERNMKHFNTSNVSTNNEFGGLKFWCDTQKSRIEQLKLEVDKQREKMKKQWEEIEYWNRAKDKWNKRLNEWNERLQKNEDRLKEKRKIWNLPRK